MSSTLSIKDVAEALRDQLLNYAGLDYASDSGYSGTDPSALVGLGKFPFFNIAPENQLITKVPNMSFSELRRNTIQLTVQFATFGLVADDAINGVGADKGIMDFATDLLNGIFSDDTLGGIVAGFPEEDEEVNVDFLTIEDPENQRYIAGGEMSIKFYKDLEV